MGKFQRIYDSKDECYALIDPSKVSAVVGPHRRTTKFLCFTLEEYWIIEIHIEGKVISIYFGIEDTANNWHKIILRDW